jgi:transposase
LIHPLPPGVTADSAYTASLLNQIDTYPAGPGRETAVEFAINPAMIREAFAADLPEETTALMTAT